MYAINRHMRGLMDGMGGWAVGEPMGQLVSGWKSESSVSGCMLEPGRESAEDWVDWRVNLSAWGWI